MLLLKKAKCKENLLFMFSKNKTDDVSLPAYKAKIEMVDATCIGLFSLTNQENVIDFSRCFIRRQTSGYKINLT